jgi:alpha-tubulin suppressor-like RCC1 family protein
MGLSLKSASAPRLARLLPLAATLLVSACGDSTTAPATPAKLAFTVQPVTSIGGTFMPTFKVAVQDAAGNTITDATNTITLGIAVNPGQDSLVGTKTVSAVNGVATFADVSIRKLGNGYVLIATSGNLVPAASNVFDVTFGPANTLLFTSQPLTTIAGAALKPVTVIVLDIAGNTVTSATNSITVSIGTNPGGGTLTGTTTVTPVNGIATFSNLSINNAGVGYTLSVASTSLTGATTSAFTIRNPFVFTTISAGYFHTCGLTTGGAAYCWGDNAANQVGSPGFSASADPVEVSGGINFAKLAAGRGHSCGVNTGGVAYCWGDNSYGQLGVTSGSTVPVVVSGNYTFAAANGGYLHSCGVTTAGAGYCWGDNSGGELGNASASPSSSPVAVSGGLTFANISPGRFFTCGIATAGAAYCWGNNFDGELGDGTTTQRTTPVAVSGQLSFAVVGAGGFHSCGLTTSGLAYCWGYNGDGQLGNATVIPSSKPVAVSGSLTFATLSVGNRHTCGVTTAGAAYCWGENSTGHLGNGGTVGSQTPVAVSGGLTFARISAGRFHTCGVTTAGAGYCWGSGFLGDGSTAGSLVPVLVR